MLINDQLAALRDTGIYSFEQDDVCGGKTVIVFPDGRRNLVPYSISEIRHGCRWTDVTADMEMLSKLTSHDAIQIAEALHDCIAEAQPDVAFAIDAFTKGQDRPIRFKATSGRLTVRGGFPIDMEGVECEARRIVENFASAQKIVDEEIDSWRLTTIDACCVAVAAGLSGLDNQLFFERIARDSAKVEGVVGDSGEPVASVRMHEVSFKNCLMVRVNGRTITTTAKTRAYTFDGCRLIIKNAPQLPETLLSTLRGRKLDDLVEIAGLDGSELVVERAKVAQAGKRLQMTVHLVPTPLRMEAARALYDRIQARARPIS